jgi:hypothetical protein
MNSNKNMRKKKSKNLQVQLVQYERILSPPQIKVIPIYTRVIRYRVTTTISQETFTNNHLVRGMGGIVATSAVSAVPICAAVRLLKVEAWAPITTLGTNTTVALQWDTSGANGDFAGPSDIITDSSMDPSRPAHIVTKPPRQTLCGFWKSGAVSDTYRMLLFSAITGTIIDFTFQYTLNDGLGQNAALVVAAASAGGFYHQQILNGNAAVVALNTIA